LSQSNVFQALDRRQLLKGLFCLSGSAILTGCSGALTNTSAALIPQAVTTTPTASADPLTPAYLNISSTVTGSIGAGFTGLSYEKSALCGALFSGSNSDLIGIFKLLGPNVLRVGGNSVDTCVWNAQGAGRTAGQIAPSDVDNLAAFLKQSGWTCIYGVNLGGAATGVTTPQLAAAEAAYVAKQLGSSLLGIEIGNECDGYGAPGSYFAGNWSLTQFESLWNTFRAAIVAQTPSIATTGPASGSNVSSWTVPFGHSAAQDGLSLLTQHYYRGDGQAATSTAANLLSADTNLTNCTNLLKAAGLPFRFAECNSYFNGGAVGVSNSYASTLWVVDFLFNCAIGGAAGVNLHGGGHSAGYTPIADDGSAVVEVRPVFYGMLLFAMAGQGNLLQTQLSAGQLNASAYATQQPGSGLNVVVVNKDSSQGLQLTIQLPQTAASAKMIVMTQQSTAGAAPSLAATSGVSIQGATIGANGAFAPSAADKLSTSGSQVTCTVPAMSAVLIQIS
jgi:hypothetical protein